MRSVKSLEKYSPGKSAFRLDKGSSGGQRATQPGEKSVVLLVEALKNYKSANKSMELIIKIEFKNAVVKESNRIPYKRNGPLLINLEHIFYWNTTKPEDLDDLFAYPIVFSIYEAGPKSPTKDKKRGASEQRLKTIGHCTLDLMPMIYGIRTNINEDLVIQQEGQLTGYEIVTWPNLPRLAVQLTTNEPLMTQEEIENSNIALLTLEGVYNISSSMLDALTLSAGLSVQLQPGLYKDIIFDGGTGTTEQNTDMSKRWCNLFAQHGKAAFTDYPSRMNHDLKTIRNELDVDLKQVTTTGAPRIEWNKVRRSLLMNEAKSPFLLSLIDKNKVLPVEVLVVPRKAELDKAKQRKDKDKDREKDISDQPLHFVAYLKFEDFFQPGALKSRVCSQLFYFDFNYFKLKSSRSKCVFETRLDMLSREKKKSPSSRSNRILFQATEKDDEAADTAENIPALNDDGEPIMIIFEIELFKPIYFPESQLRKLEESELQPVPEFPPYDSTHHFGDTSQKASDKGDEEEEIPKRKSLQNKRGLVTKRFRDKNIQLPEVICKKRPLKKSLPEEELDESLQEKNTLILGLTEKFSTAKSIVPKDLTPIEPPNFNIENDEIIMNLLSNVPERLVTKLREKGINFKKPKFKDIVLDALLPKHETVRISSLANLLEKSQSIQSPMDELTQSINGLANVILDQYIHFLDLEPEDGDRIIYGLQKAKDDRIPEFILHLQSAGLYNGIREKLHHKIYCLLSNDSDENIEQKKTQKDVYISLLKNIHLHINSLHPQNYDYYECEEFHQQLFLALEAEQEGDLDKAKILYLERLGKYGDVYHHMWLEYVIYCLNSDELGTALEGTKEAIMMERRDKLAMIIYGILLCHYKYFIEANLFLEAATCFYPRSLECWMVLHLFYLLILNYKKAEWALNMAYRLYDGIIDSDSLKFPLLDMDQLFWCPIPDPRDNIFLSTARFLIKLRMTELAETALAQHMDIYGPSVPYTYYLSVNHYVAARYKDALSHLEDCSPKEDQKYCIWSLMGHCHYKLNDMPKAMEYYHQIETLDDPPHDMHLVSIRLGNCYLKYKQHKEAEKILYAISLVSPSTMTWCYLGIALYEQRKYLEAEMALSEALRLDSSCPIVWAYLALINLQHEREWEYEQCFQQAIDFNLSNCLRNRIIHIRDVRIILDSWHEEMP